MSSRNDKGQIYTMEGVTASLIILGVLLFIIQANSLVVPQTAKIVDMKLGETSNDILTCLDWSSNNSWSTTGSLGHMLQVGTAVLQLIRIIFPIPGLLPLNSNITAMLSPGVQYNLEFFYINGTGEHDNIVILNGEPGDNSMVATRLVTLNSNDASLSSYWRGDDTISAGLPQVVQVKITCWHL